MKVQVSEYYQENKDNLEKMFSLSFPIIMKYGSGIRKSPNFHEKFYMVRADDGKRGYSH